jgi:hypothetical protein
LLLVLGLVSYGDLLPPRWRVFVLVPVPAALAMLTIYALAVLLPSSYAVPPEVAAPPAAAKPVNLRYDPAIELLAAEVPPARFRAGDRVPVTLYLRARTRMTEDYPVFLQILDNKYQVMGNVTTHAGWGRNPTSLWQPGVIYADRYLVPVVNNVSALSPLLAHVYVGFMDPQARGPLPAIGEDGKEQSGMVADVVIERLGQTEQAPLRPADVVYGNVIRLIGYGLDKEVLHPKDVLRVALQWQADGVPAEELTAFVHLLDEDGRVVVGFDGPPAEGRFPTQYWRPGDTIRSEFALALPGDLPPGRYRVGAGLYTAASQGAQRVPITASSQQFKDNIALLSEVEVR